MLIDKEAVKGKIQLVREIYKPNLGKASRLVASKITPLNVDSYAILGRVEQVREHVASAYKWASDLYL